MLIKVDHEHQALHRWVKLIQLNWRSTRGLPGSVVRLRANLHQCRVWALNQLLQFQMGVDVRCSSRLLVRLCGGFGQRVRLYGEWWGRWSMRGCSLVRGHGPMFYVEDELMVELEVIDWSLWMLWKDNDIGDEPEGYDMMGERWRRQETLPYIVINTSHHPRFSLPHSDGEAIGFALAFCDGWLRTYGAIWIHDLEVFVVSGVLD